MNNTIHTKLKGLILISIVLLSGCRICMVCTGLSQEPCKSAMPHMRPLLDSLYASHYHIHKWGVENCSYDKETGNITLLTITNPAENEKGITLIFDTNYVMKDISYPKAKKQVY